MQYVFQSTTTAYKYFGFWEWAKVFYIFVTFLCLSALLKAALSHCIYVLFCLPAVYGLPFHMDSSSGVVSPSSWAWVHCDVVLKLSRGSQPDLLSPYWSTLCLFHVFPLKPLAVWHRDSEGVCCALLAELVKLTFTSVRCCTSFTSWSHLPGWKPLSQMS